ncbi:flagellar hook-length control protein FliK [uncultured Paracoccus sp.]|uniref:flagellar hook-length control protein FliK n=1 Tax=uncultured Paracoccus sp. TaxID=189685 RepID=UPI002627578F|nr:flagellar hook-length control protein FliK [uncultured Paracoccus sp.]
MKDWDMDHVMMPVAALLTRGGAGLEAPHPPGDPDAGPDAGFEAQMAEDGMQLSGQLFAQVEGEGATEMPELDARCAAEPALDSADQSQAVDGGISTDTAFVEVLPVDVATTDGAVPETDAPEDGATKDVTGEGGVGDLGLPTAAPIAPLPVRRPEEAGSGRLPGPNLAWGMVPDGAPAAVRPADRTPSEAMAEMPALPAAPQEVPTSAAGPERPARQGAASRATPPSEVKGAGEPQRDADLALAGAARPEPPIHLPPLQRQTPAPPVLIGHDSGGPFDRSGSLAVLSPFLLPVTAHPAHAAAGRTGPIPISAETLCRQVGEAALRMQDDRIEIALSPEELGSVRLVLSRGEAGAALTVWVERPEVLEMLRRHSDLLMGDLRNSGLGDANLAFRDGSGGQSGSGSYSAPGGPWAANMRSADAIGSNAGDVLSSLGQRSLADGGRLDIRV